MRLELSDDQVQVLMAVLDQVVSDMSPEIADTDNVEYRSELKRRRDLLSQVRAQLGGA